jgi:outer membrane protein TolC
MDATGDELLPAFRPGPRTGVIFVSEEDEAYRISALRFERGLGTQLEVNDAQFALLSARVNAARATIDYYLAAAELARSHGRDVPPPPTRSASR